jgi:hypothetical protein
MKETKRLLEKHQQNQANLIIFLHDTISLVSITKLQAHHKYNEAINADVSFDLWNCLAEAHSGSNNINMIAFRMKEFVNLECKEGQDFHSHSVEHQTKANTVFVDIESPTCPGFVSIDVIKSVFMLTSLNEKSWGVKKEAISEQLKDNIQTLDYGATIADLQRYYTRHCTLSGGSFKKESSELCIMTTKIVETITCTTCGKVVPRTEIKTKPGQYFKNCKECGIKFKEAKGKELNNVPTDEDIKKAKDLLARVPAVITQSTEPTQTNQLSVNSAILYTEADVARMIAQSHQNTFGNY